MKAASTSAPLPKVTGLRCVLCSAVYAHGEVEYTCPRCGIEGILDVEYDAGRIGKGFSRRTLESDRDLSLWRYRALLPIPDDAAALPPPRIQVGFTPVVEAPALAVELGLGALLVKDDGRNPTASFKDRASSVGVTRARWLGRNEITCSSTGNAASSLAGFAAEAGMKAFIFVPASAPEAKVAQLLVYGAKVFLVEGPYEDAFRVCQAAVLEFGWYNRNCAINPYLVEGKKTCGLEIAEQMRERLPDVVTVALGDGCTTAGIWKGLVEMKTHGIIDRLPRILAVQAEGAAPLAKTFARGDARGLGEHTRGAGQARNPREDRLVARSHDRAARSADGPQGLDAVSR
ncbi:MAG: pyridoxal-phosphate dependent enzyme, partial [Thermoanaerobaculia bacterium]|nr:pyridoxal-phosphate dependent enzyme [Thermoanaerobaculia bacterium]